MRRIKSKWIGTTVCLTLLALIFSYPVNAATIELKISSYEPEQSHLIQNAYLPWCSEIEKRTNGKVKFKWYHSGSLVKAEQTVRALEIGLVDVVASVGIWTQENQWPVSQVFSLPFLFENSHQADMTYMKAVENIPELKTEYSKIKMLGFHATDLVNIHSVVAPPKTMADMKGLKLFAASRTAAQMLPLLGATPVNVNLGDVYMSLQRKAIDGVFFPTAPLAAYKFTDVVNNHLIIQASVGLIPLAMSMKTWNNLPPDVQKVFEDMKPSITSLLGYLVDNRRDHILEQLEKRGDNIYYLPEDERAKWRKETQPVYDGWFDLMKSQGIDGQALLKQVTDIASELKSASPIKEVWWGSEHKN